MLMIINPFEGIKRTNIFGPNHGGEDYSTGRKHTVIAACDGVAHWNGGTFGELIIKLDDGRSIRYAENESPIGIYPRRVTIFEPIAQNALYRAPYYRDTHINGIDTHGNRIRFTDMVTISQSDARLKLKEYSVQLTDREILPNKDANIRTFPNRDHPANIVNKFKAGTQINPYGFVYGQPVNGNALWYITKLDDEKYPIEYVWSGGTTDISPHDLIQLQERENTMTDTSTGTPNVVAVETPIENEQTKNEHTMTVENGTVLKAPNPNTNIKPNIVTSARADTPVISYDSSKVDSALDSIAGTAKLIIRKDIRKKIYNYMSKVGLIGASIGGSTIATALVIGGDIGNKIAGAGAIITAISSGLAGLANKLADVNTKV